MISQYIIVLLATIFNAAFIVPIAGFWLGHRLRKNEQLPRTNKILRSVSNIALTISFFCIATAIVSSEFSALVALSFVFVVAPSILITFVLSSYSMLKGYFPWHSGIVVTLALTGIMGIIHAALRMIGI